MLKNKKLFLLDMDGTIYLDNNLFDGTIDFLTQVKANNARYVFLTNNSSKSTEAYVAKLNKIGIAAAKDDFLTSTDATIDFLNQNYKDTCFYCVGTQSFVDELVACGVKVALELCEGIGGVILSNDQELTFKKLEDVCLLLKNDIPYIATNPDWVCPTAFGYVPDCGSFAEMISRATGKMPKFIGKPNPEMIYLALEKYGIDKDDAVMIGDRVYTDIAAGYNAGIDTVLVLSGESTLKDATNTDTPPTYILENIKVLYAKIK